ncbi:unnamed protein product [Ixodes persulcatus]
MALLPVCPLAVRTLLHSMRVGRGISSRSIHAHIVFFSPSLLSASWLQVLVPCLSFQNLSTATRTETINANMTLRLTSKQPLLCEAQGIVSSRGHSNPVRDNTAPIKGHDVPATTRVEAADDANARLNPLVVVLAWMKAKDAHLQRYHDLYMDQGFDVLTVKTDPMQLAFPTNKGSQYIAQMVLDFLLNNPNYARLVVHAFSVGGYQMGEILVRMRKGGSRYLDLAPRFKAQVYDSLVDYTGIPTGFPTALTKSQFLRKVLEIMIRVQSVIMYPMSTVHYKAASRAFHDNPLMCPALMINSKEDQVSGLEDNIRVADCWRKKGLDVAFCTFDDSKHVQHMGKYPDQYENEVLRLLRKVQLAA